MTPKTETRLIDSAKRWMTEHGYRLLVREGRAH